MRLSRGSPDVPVQIGISTLTDIQPVTVDGRHVTAIDRMNQIVRLGVRADELDLDLVGVGEHHSSDFVVSSPAVVLAAIASRTTRVRLTSAVTVLSVLDPVRVYQDYASLDLVSGGRAEITAGRSAYAEPFALFGLPLSEYGELFEEKLDLLLKIRQTESISWQGRYRPELAGEPVTPRALQPELPVWIGAGGSPESVVRAARLGLPLILGYLGGSPAHLAQSTDLYRRAGEQFGTSEKLRVGIALHYLGAASEAEAASAYPYYRDFLRPKAPAGSGFVVSRENYDAGRGPGQALMIGETAPVIDKLVALHAATRFDRIQALVDWGGLPPALVEESIERLGTEIAPSLREAVGG
jgi:alkanesulfonate monooxygenase SsuD/methylene tetrahydromethanopterin reductase-like flavin-dependent oxidoreductase (luciferase family)